MNKTIKIFAWIDLVIGVLLAMPVIGVQVLLLLQSFISEELLIVDIFHALLMKILGMMVLLWAVVRIRRTEKWQVNYDCVARLWVIGYMSYYCYYGLPVLIFFIIIECLGLLQWVILFREKS